MSEFTRASRRHGQAERAVLPTRQPALVQSSLAAGAIDLPSLAPLMFAFMFRNIATAGFTFTDPMAPQDHSKDSRPGCVIAAPSYPAGTPGVDQDYVFNWVRDGAITAMEVARIAFWPSAGGTLDDYVRFAALCHANAVPTKGHACFTIAGESRPWSEQNDGPALQTVTLLTAFDRLSSDMQSAAVGLVNANVEFLLGVFQDATTNLWEEHVGFSFFARSAQLRCFETVLATTVTGVAKPAGLQAAADWLRQALDGHWDGTRYVSVLAVPSDGSSPSQPVVDGYDPNIDIVQACIYGAVPCTDTRLLATAAQLRAQWEEGGLAAYPINTADRERGLGPLFGRYPGDTYDGDSAHPVLGGHPWALTTCNVAELHYALAAAVRSTGRIPLDDLSQPFFAQVGVDATMSADAAATAMVAAGDAMVGAVVFHSDHLELSEQYDGTTGFERSVRDLTWSYAAYLSAMRARAAVV